MAKKSKRRTWTAADVRTLKTAAKKKTGAASIARSLRRTEGATRQKAFSIGLSLDSRCLTLSLLSPQDLSPAGVRAFIFDAQWPKQSNPRLDFLADALERRVAGKGRGRCQAINRKSTHQERGVILVGLYGCPYTVRQSRRRPKSH